MYETQKLTFRQAKQIVKFYQENISNLRCFESIHDNNSKYSVCFWGLKLKDYDMLKDFEKKMVSVMNKERATFLLNSAVYGSLPYSYKLSFQNNRIYEYGITKEEDSYIRKIWKTLAGNTTYNDALLKIEKGAKRLKSG